MFFDKYSELLNEFALQLTRDMPQVLSILVGSLNRLTSAELLAGTLLSNLSISVLVNVCTLAYF